MVDPFVVYGKGCFLFGLLHPNNSAHSQYEISKHAQGYASPIILETPKAYKDAVAQLCVNEFVYVLGVLIIPTFLNQVKTYSISSKYPQNGAVRSDTVIDHHIVTD